MFRLGESGVRRFLVPHHEREREVARGVVVPHPGRAFLRRVLDVHHGGKGFVIDFDGLGGKPRVGRAVRDHESDAVPDVAHLRWLEQRPEGPVSLRTAHVLGHEKRRNTAELFGFDILSRQYQRNAGHGLRGRGVDAPDARVRMRRHDDRAVQHVRQLDVVDVARAAGKEALVFHPADRLTDSEAVHLLGLNLNMFIRFHLA